MSEETRALARWLEGEPELRKRLVALQATTAGETGAGRSLDEAESELVVELRGLGRELLTRWTEEKQNAEALRQQAQGRHRHGKKNSGC